MSHLDCRMKCENSTCLGYAYAPCERICTVYGNPNDILHEGPDGWRALNGWGTLKMSSGQCGSACFLRKDPCEGHRVVSNGAYVWYDAFRFATTIYEDCPAPYVGTLALRCGLGGVSVEAGRCQRNCSGGESISGSFNVPYLGMFHGEIQTVACSVARIGALGSVSVTCRDGTVLALMGTCGFGCQQGSARAGSGIVAYPAMDHLVVDTLQCPAGFFGSVDVVCNNGYINAESGRCDAHCSTGDVNITVGPTNGTLPHGLIQHGYSTTATCSPAENLTGIVQLNCFDGETTHNESAGHCYQHCPAGSVLPGIKAVDYARMLHNSTRALTCNAGFAGALLVECLNGTVEVLQGACNMHCNGTARHVNEFLQGYCNETGLCVDASVTSNGVTLPYGFIQHLGNKTLACPNVTHTGELDVTCNDGVVGYTGVCGRNCPEGVVASRGASMSYTPMQHAEERRVECPLPWGGAMSVRCYDGDARITGACGAPCQPGIYQRNGAQINHAFMNHSERRNYSCLPQFSVLRFSGTIEFECLDGFVHSNGACYPDCAPVTLEDNGASIIVPDVEADKSIVTNCEPGPEYGIVEVGCVRGLPRVVGGTCGSPCLAGEYVAPRVGDLPIALPEIGHTAREWHDCNPQLSGRVLFQCDSSYLRILEGSCGMRCPATPQDVIGARFTTSRMEHESNLSVPCTAPYTGVVEVSCAFGQLNVTSGCVKGCFAGFLNVNGAYVPYPEMLSGGRFQTACPAGFAGEVLLECLNEFPYALVGTCQSHCQAGRWMAPEDGPSGTYPVVHDLIRYNTTKEAPCPTGYDGYTILRCDAGSVVLESGGCFSRCANGRMITRPGVQFRYAGLAHGEMTSSMQCPNGFVGSVRLYCNNSVVSVGMGGCPAHCQGGGIEGAVFGGMLHEEIADLVCPENSIPKGFGTLHVRCYDGDVIVLSGHCIYGCLTGAIQDARGSSIEYGDMEHEGNTTGTCSGDSTGFVRVKCNDTNVYADPLPGEKCYQHCLPRDVTTFDNSTVQTPYIYHGQTASVDCPAGRAGVVMVQCFDSGIAMLEGWCGDMNCAAGDIFSGDAIVPFPQMNHERTSLAPVDCNAGRSSGYLGSAYFACANGSTKVRNVTHFLPVLAEDSPGVVNVTNLSAIEKEEHDDEFFLLCSCCVPPEDPPAPGPGLAVDLRVVLYWAVGTGTVGLLVAAVTGWVFSKGGKAKVSRVSPDPAASNKIADLKMLTSGPDPGVSPGRMLALEGPRASFKSTAEAKGVRQQMAIEWRNDNLPTGSLQARKQEFKERKARGLSVAVVQHIGNITGSVPPRS